MKTKSLLLLLLVGLLACNTRQEATTTPDSSPTDPHSYARPETARTKHLNLQLTVDFTKRQLKGVARWDIQKHDASEIIFDTKDLQILLVTLGESESKTAFLLSEPDSLLGSELRIALEPAATRVNIYYQTNPDNAAALDWLDPQQTADKKHPFLFTQGQAILTRSWIPCQDSPGIRVTYEADIQVPKDLMAVMSAANPQEKSPDGRYHFSMQQPIPPYLIALAVGDLSFLPIGPRTGVYAEPSVVEAAAYEFADTEKMLEAAETLYGPYDWERYDIIVLPPSFPFGGMENPRLTFATPTIIAGDRSLTTLIAHELAHSWSGNLVTNANWDDFWLNEGFTVYFERRIMEALYGRDYADMIAQIGYQDLQEDIELLGADSPDTHLKLNLTGRDPDEGMTDIAYEKGAFFLETIEKAVGRDTFDQFLTTYFSSHRFQTMTTENFITYLQKELLGPQQVSVNFNDWVYGPGIPGNMPDIHSVRFDEVDKSLQSFLEGAPAKSIQSNNWFSLEWIHFLRGLPDTLSQTQMEELDNAFSFTQSGNAEIAAAWFEQAIYSGYSPTITPTIEAFLVRVGRRKFLTPLYRALKNTDQLELARSIYLKARPNYHSISRGSIETLLGFKPAPNSSEK